ncbi:MAG: CBS domain-containing protein [Planctomycetales bacterium]|nr:CBS domain-containing protein [Planctomycetales bacterium]
MSVSPDPNEFQDPLENYDPEQYSDTMEEALANQPVSAIQSTPYASVPPNATVREAVERLAELKVACLLVEENQKLVGVFSDRDVLDKVALEYDQVQNQPVSTVMTRNPVFVYESESAGAVLNVMAVQGFRHVPVLDSKDHIVGVASPARITSFLKTHLEKS